MGLPHLVAVLLLAIAASCYAAYDASLIVPNVTTGCPVANQLWSPEEYSLDKLVSTLAPMFATSAGSSDPCAAQAPSLATCATDDSLGVKVGCCSTACAQQLKQVEQANCFGYIINEICNASTTQQGVRQFVQVLLNAADRCVGYTPPPGVGC